MVMVFLFTWGDLYLYRGVGRGGCFFLLLPLDFVHTMPSVGVSPSQDVFVQNS